MDFKDILRLSKNTQTNPYNEFPVKPALLMKSPYAACRDPGFKTFVTVRCQKIFGPEQAFGYGCYGYFKNITFELCLI
ncbi:predicted protein [Sclerotinia sclerotiorum 1980 UF-70]|uniref:Uncharacterized protein n=1 Tax=Sclerotinia sclerotiorum (strain ATCC 18683 / 1980 / Ss-1) TaxID=665079 RepID=A7ETR7_SCLS1|nr:predicted protein [Sclerotinia sclerotiorum 1980 UF-70]EDN92859.1 predicted protein [Sclerotinia sclerotiorum 1980 UF-70]